MPDFAADSPEFAALSGFPAHAGRVVATDRVDGSAYVLIIRAEGPPYLYGVNLERIDGRWVVTSSGNGPGWSRTSLLQDLGTLTLWGEAPADAEWARASYKDELIETVLDGNVYLFTWWDVPCPKARWPRVEAFLIAGTWVPAAPH